jgi:hypothetical protein
MFWKKIVAAVNGFIRDKHGRIMVWQTPNLPLAGWLLCMIAARFIHPGQIRTTLEFISTAALFTWAYLEITQGASYFRRTLGLLVLVSLILSH